MEWIVDSVEAYDEFCRLIDPIDDSELRIAVGEAMLGWRQVGPPRDAVWDEATQAFYCDIPGTPVVAEFVTREHGSPPEARVTKFHWAPHTS